MKGIKLKEDLRKKEKRNQFLIGTIMIFIMMLSVFGIAMSSVGKQETDKVNYNGFEFTNQNNLWILQFENLDFWFKYNPNEIEIEDINASEEFNLFENYYNQVLYVYSEDREAELEVYRNLNQVVERIQPACLEQENCEGNFPLVNCEKNSIIIQENNLKSRIVGQVHDSIVIDADESEVDLIINKVSEFMIVRSKEHWDWIKTPLFGECDKYFVNGNWSDCEDSIDMEYNPDFRFKCENGTIIA